MRTLTTATQIFNDATEEFTRPAKALILTVVTLIVIASGAIAVGLFVQGAPDIPFIK